MLSFNKWEKLIASRMGKTVLVEAEMEEFDMGCKNTAYLYICGSLSLLMRVAINGMGRIGRLLCRRLSGMKGVELVAVNDIMNPENLAYLLRYDSVYGTLPGNFMYRDGSIRIDDSSFAVLRQPDA